ncbi:DotU family type IV/VI secretion system protein, partial [Cronobacter sakazakii]|uniref:DotU family type IV/VI secretion system protein n=1 Tax=Cronobacter sakazakii TaxID=28141 RepID=UPI001EFD1BC9
ADAESEGVTGGDGMKIFRPLWNEGALLSPQQFQQQSAWEAFTNAGVLGLSSPFPWGVELVITDEGQREWRMAPLQAKYFGSLRAGEALWDRIAEVLRQPAPLQAVLTCYHRVLSLGFQGLYGVKTVSQTQREETLNALSARVPIRCWHFLRPTRRRCQAGKRAVALPRFFCAAPWPPWPFLLPTING